MPEFFQHWQRDAKPLAAAWDTRFYQRRPQHQQTTLPEPCILNIGASCSSRR